MAKKNGKNSKFFGEFKTFIARGNVLDMAVGVIVGGAFTAIVNALGDNILKPLINALLALVFRGDSLGDIVTVLKGVYVADETTGKTTLDLAQSIYIDWGAVINAVINFLIVAFVLFCIVRTINKINETQERIVEETKRENAAVRKYRKDGLKRREAIAKYKAELEAEKAAAEAKAAEEKRLADEAAEAKAKAEEEKALANTRLLEEIRDLLKAKNA